MLGVRDLLRSRRISDRLVQHLFLIALPAISHAGFQLIFTAMLRRHMGTTTTVSQVGVGVGVPHPRNRAPPAALQASP